ncbi:MAG: FecR domain-containing protein [Bacteroidota bacterium]
MDNNYEAYQYAGLIVKYLKGEISAREEAKLNAWIEEKPENALLLQKLKDETSIKTDLDFLSSINMQDAWQNVVMQASKTSFTDKVYIFIKKWKYAAIILVSLSVAVFVYTHRQPVLKLQTINIKKNKYKNDVPPGTDKAKLTLADGSVVVMDGHTSGIVKKYNGLNIISEHGIVNYQITARAPDPVNKVYNTITTPIGCKYKLTLPDGSLVWLNSGSSLKFPVAFNSTSRSVYLTGEAYFEVTKNKHKPFSVFANRTEVRVLGTHFNIHAYDDEDAVKTSLLEGSVKILRDGKSKMITPGQQASVNYNSAKIKIDNIDVNGSIDWKNDLFNFESEDIESVMKEVARWYNVEVEYRDVIPQAHFSGIISRNNNISQILNMLELTGGVHFSIDGRKITVTK